MGPPSPPGPTGLHSKQGKIGGPAEKRWGRRATPDPEESPLRRPWGPGSQSAEHPSPLPARTARHPHGDPQGPGLVGHSVVPPSAPCTPGHNTRRGAEGKRVPCTHLGRRRSLMAADGDERRGAAPRGEGTEGVVFRRPPRPPPRALALAAALAEAAGAEYPSGAPVPPLLPASAPRPPMSPRRGTALPRVRSGASPAAPTGSPAHRKRRARGGGEERPGASGKEDPVRGGPGFCLFCSRDGPA